MAHDIHWLIERRHPDGAWDTVFSDVRLHEINPQRLTDEPSLSAAEHLCERNLPRFSILSDLGRTEGAPLATPGLPDDVSDYARNYLAGDIKAIKGYSFLEPRPFEFHGHLSLATLIASSDSDVHDLRIGLYSSLFAQDIEKMQPLLDREILFGNVRTDNPGPRHPDMDAASNHTRLAMSQRQAELLPIEPQNLRLVVAYEP